MAQYTRGFFDLILKDGSPITMDQALAEMNELREMAEDEWRRNHDEVCSNVGNCTTFDPDHKTECCYPKPEVLL